MKTRIGFISNSSSCSFVCHKKLTIEEVENQLINLIDFHNEQTGSSLKFNEMFNKSFIANEKMTKIYERRYGLYDNLDYCRPIKGKVIIHPKIEDNEFPYALDTMIESYLPCTRLREDGGIEEFIKEAYVD